MRIPVLASISPLHGWKTSRGWSWPVISTNSAIASCPEPRAHDLFVCSVKWSAGSQQTFALCNAGLNGWKAPWGTLFSVVVRCLGTEDVHRKVGNMPVVLFLSLECTAQQTLLFRTSLMSPDYFRLPPRSRWVLRSSGLLCSERW
jgi:hypothetical protein